MKNHVQTILIFFFITISLCQAQSPILWGMTNRGGSHDSGTIFKYNTLTGEDTILHSFGNGTDGYSPDGSLIEASNGLLYGMTSSGGAYGYGTIFSYNISTSDYFDLHDFGNGTDGYSPIGSFIQASNGLLYGTTSNGGSYSNGTIFSYSISTGKEVVIHNFGTGTDGADPRSSLIQVSDSLLYGVTASGGTSFGGTIFSYNISTGTETDLYNFPGNTSPNGSLLQVSNGLLYGMTTRGSVSSFGTIFNFNISNGTETDIYDFVGNSTDGFFPYGSFIQVGDSLLYGLTSSGGGTSDGGTVFNYNIFTGKETVLHAFRSVFNDGEQPDGSLIQANNGLLYGMTSFGGINSDGNQGTIFSFNILTDLDTIIHDFGASLDGKEPGGNLIEVDTPSTGINYLLVNKSLSIYPNPTFGQLTIKSNNNQNGYDIEIYNMMGEKIYQSILRISENVINLSAQPAGMYFVYLKSEEGVEVGKVLVTR